MVIAPLDLIEAHPWQRITFTTYALSLSFFEAVILDRLVRGGGSHAFILTDVQGVRASLSEQGAQRVGMDYEVEPIAVLGGVFHPKLTVLTAVDECHLLVGSGNLTFGGWGGNCEILEHVHPSFAASAIADTAEFFELMPSTTRIRQSIGGAEYCASLAADLRGSIKSSPMNGEIRLVHNLKSSISEQLAQLAGDLGGALRLVAVAPFWDDGSAIDNLCSLLGLSEVFVHVHPYSCVEGYRTQNWPRRCNSKVQAVQIEEIDSEGPRRLHAKAFEIMCRRGRIILSGSANGSSSALGQDANIEACIARLQWDRMIGWTFIASDPPELQAAIEEDLSDREQVPSVLCAVLEGDQLKGEILAPLMKENTASVFLLTASGPELLAETTVSPLGLFQVTTPTLEERSWSGGRLVIRVLAQDGWKAEGFVSVASFTDIKLRAGVQVRKLFALLAGTETPTDVAAIMAWFYEDPDRLLATGPTAIHASFSSSQDETSDQRIPVSLLSQDYMAGAVTRIPDEVAAQKNWTRFIDQILRAFRIPRGPFEQRQSGDGSDEEDQPTEAFKPAVTDSSTEELLPHFQRLFERFTKSGTTSRSVITAFDVAQYICDRLSPSTDQAKSWLERLVHAFLQIDVPSERRSDAAAGVLTLIAMTAEPEITALKWARGCLLRLGFDFSEAVPREESVRGFMSVLPTKVSFGELWSRLRTQRTYQEQVRAYLEAVRSSKTSDDYPDLPRDAREEWPILEEAITSESARRRLAVTESLYDACPKCHMKLPAAEASKLRRIGIARAVACCSRVVIRSGLGA